MKCEKCGKDLSENSNFCRFCGNPVKLESDNKVNEDLTDKIDINKINIDSFKINDNTDDEINDMTEELDMKVEAMKEISKTQSFVFPVVDIKPVEPIKEEEKKDETNDILNIEFMPGTINKLDIESTSELKKMLLPEEEDFDTKLIPDSITDLKVNEIDILEKEFKKNNQSLKSSDKAVEIKNDSVNELDINVAISSQVTDNVSSEKSAEKKAESEVKAENYNDKEQNTKEDITPIIDSVFDNENLSQDKVKKGKGCLVFILLFPIIVALAICLAYFYKENDKLDSKNSKYEKKVETLEKELSSVDKNKGTSNTKSFIYEGYKIDFYKDYNYKIQDDFIVINNSKNSYYSKIENIEFLDIKNDLDSYVLLIEKQEYEVISHGTKVIDNREYVFFEIKDSENNNNLVAYTELSENSVSAVFVTFEQNTIDYDILIEYNGIVDCFTETNVTETTEFNFFEEN